MFGVRQNLYAAQGDAENRWRRVDRALRQSEELPAISLYKVGGSYFVLDGHHRISVARYHGVEWIEAEVTEARAGVRSDRKTNESGLG
jgi:hypothetical protein